MAFHAGQFGDLIGRVLDEYGLGGPAAVHLLLGTAAVESDFGTYFRQVGGGPALGIFQMERPTFQWLRGLYAERFPAVGTRCFEDVEWDLRLAILLARLRYHAAPERLPGAGDVPGMAAYWKEHYNTRLGKGTVGAFVTAYGKYVERGK